MGVTQQDASSTRKKKHLGIFILVILIFIFLALFLFWYNYGSHIFRNKETNMSPSIVTATCIGTDLGGRLGNQLFQAATVLGTAKKNRCNSLFDKSIENTDVFKLIQDTCDIQVSSNKLKYGVKVKEKEGVFNTLEFPEDGRTYDLNGYFQSHLYFNSIEDKLRKNFRPKDKWLKEALKISPQAFLRNSIGLHIRRGDYISSTYKDKLAHPPISYYYKATKLILEKINADDKVYIIVVSDDVEWCKDKLVPELSNLKNIDIILHKSHPDPQISQFIDFAILYSCHNQVMANSSFSWWTAFLKPVADDNEIIERTIVAPYPWYQPGGDWWHIQTDNLYYPDWVIMEHTNGQVRSKSNIAELSSLYKKRNPINDKSKLEYNKNTFNIDNFYVINMDNQIERWKATEVLLNHMGIYPTRYSAVDKNTISEIGGRTKLKQMGLIDRDDSGLEGDAAIGCGLSHMSIWSSIVDEPDNTYICIFEDDIASYINKEDLMNKLQVAWDNMDADWDLLYLGRCIDNCSNAIKVTDGLYKPYRPYCFHSYVISARGARKLLSKPLYTGVDTQAVRDIEIGALKAYTFHPSIFIQDILKWNSNLRNFKMQINNSCDCKLD